MLPIRTKKLAERVGFEPTWRVISPPRRFRGAPVTTTSVPLRESRRPRKSFSNVLAAVFEEILQYLPTIWLQYARHDRQPMRHADLVQIKQRFHTTELGLGGTIDQCSNTCVHNGTNTHHTRLDGNVERQAGKSVIPELSSRFTNRDDLGMGGGVHRLNRLVEPGGNDLLVARHYGTDRNFTQMKRVSRLIQGELHHLLLRPDSPSPHPVSRIPDLKNLRKETLEQSNR